jgi:hypothetical protein
MKHDVEQRPQARLMQSHPSGAKIFNRRNRVSTQVQLAFLQRIHKLRAAGHQFGGQARHHKQREQRLFGVGMHVGDEEMIEQQKSNTSNKLCDNTQTNDKHRAIFNCQNGLQNTTAGLANVRGRQRSPCAVLEARARRSDACFSACA